VSVTLVITASTLVLWAQALLIPRQKKHIAKITFFINRMCFILPQKSKKTPSNDGAKY